MIKNLGYLLIIIICCLLLDGCALVAPDQFKYEVGVDETGHYNGMKTGFSWNLPQPK